MNPPVSPGIAGFEGEEKEEEHVAPKVRKPVNAPSEKEVREHYKTHIPFRSWCPHCVRGRAKAGFHMKKGKEDEGTEVPVISFDYMYLKDGEKKEDRGTEEAEEDTAGRGMPILVGKDRKHK